MTHLIPILIGLGGLAGFGLGWLACMTYLHGQIAEARTVLEALSRTLRKARRFDDTATVRHALSWISLIDRALGEGFEDPT